MLAAAPLPRDTIGYRLQDWSDRVMPAATRETVTPVCTRFHYGSVALDSWDLS